MGVVAQYRGYCENCGEPYPEGTVIRRNREEMWVHEVCPDDPHLPDTPPPACPECFMVLPCMCGYYEKED